MDATARKYHFSDSTSIEKYIIDFEILFHVFPVLPDCAVKGGMAVPFHINESLKRLSEDIDIVTRCTKEETECAIEGLRKDLEPMVDIRLYTPNNPHKRLPLLTYDCKYRSITGDSQIKLEIFYKNEEDVRTKMIDDGFEIMGFTVDFPILVYDHAPLIIDKLTTLAFNTIGIPELRRHDVPKQIYDIASLLKSFNGVLPIDEMIDLLKKISKSESGYCQNEYSFEDILADLEVFSDSIVDNELKLDPRSKGHLGTFRTNLLASSYTNTNYVTDILLIVLFVKLIRSGVNETQDPKTIGSRMNAILTKLKNISNSISDRTWRREIIKKYDDQEKKYVNRFPNQQLYLYHCIQEIERTSHLPD